MGCCGFCKCEPNEEDPVTKIKPYEERGCTDPLMLLAFIMFWGIIFIIMGTALEFSAPIRLVKGVDYAGCVCGVDNSYDDKCHASEISQSSNKEDLPFAAWPYPWIYDFKVCVDNCEITNNDNTKFAPHPSIEFMSSYCIPNPIFALNATDGFQSASAMASRAFGDLRTTWPVILVAAFFAAIFSFIYAFFLKRFAKIIVWGTLLLVIFSCFLVSYGFLWYGDKVAKEETAPDRAEALRGFGWVCVALTVIFCIVVYALRKRINIAIEVVKETCQAITDMPSMVVFPLWPFLAVCVYAVFWIIVALYIFAVQKPTNIEFPTFYYPVDYPVLKDDQGNDIYVASEWDDSYQGSIGAHFFHLLWNLNFFIYFSYLTIAGAVAAWYFTPYVNGEKPRGDGEGQLSDSAVMSSMKITLRYHLGSIAFGSLIIAIIQFIRAVMVYLEKKAEIIKYETIKKVIFCIINCCLYCVECCMDKINRNGYIWMAIYGDNFCKSACSAFKIIYANLLRVAAMSMVGEYLVLLGKVLIALFPTGLAAMILTQSDIYKDTLNSIVMPCLVIFLLSYVIGAIFMTVFETASDTIFLCFLVDDVNNRKSGKMFASQALQDLIDSHKAENEEEAKNQRRDAHDQELGVQTQSASNSYQDQASAPTE